VYSSINELTIGKGLGLSRGATMSKYDLTDVFVSHSSEDKEYADELVSLLEKCIDFFGFKIICTSVVGYGLEFGKEFEKALRKHIESCDVFISLIYE
jgi:CRISPR/Cas system-associated protein Cas7 (RAMP superfamily)